MNLKEMLCVSTHLSPYQRGKAILDFGEVIKWAPIVCFLVLWIHCIGLVSGFKTELTDYFWGNSIYCLVVMYAGSMRYGYCRLHQSLTIYDALVSFCMDFQKVHDFGVLLQPLRWLMVVLGVILLTWLIINRGVRVHHEKKTAEDTHNVKMAHVAP